MRKVAADNLAGHKWVVQTYLDEHAIRKADAARATFCLDERKSKRKLKSGTPGKGRYKTWTPQAMLRNSLLLHKFMASISSWEFFFWVYLNFCKGGDF